MYVNQMLRESVIFMIRQFLQNLNDFDDFSFEDDWSWVSFSIKSEVDEEEAASTSKGRFNDRSTSFRRSCC